MPRKEVFRVAPGEYLAKKDWKRALRSVARQGTCTRKRVGAIILDAEEVVVGLGYNRESDLETVVGVGDVSGLPAGFRKKVRRSCAEDCPRAASSVQPFTQYRDGPGACISVHAEPRAILSAGVANVALGTAAKPWSDCLVIVTYTPCPGCMHMIEQLGMRWQLVDAEIDNDRKWRIANAD